MNTNGHFKFAVAVNFTIAREVQQAIHYAAKQGVTLSTIARWVGCHPNTVSRVLRASRLDEPVARRPRGERGKEVS